MKIAIIGTGNVGGALAQNLIKAKHSVLMGAQFPLSDKSLKLAAKIGEDRFCPVESAVKQSDVVIITTPPQAIVGILSALGDIDITSKTLIDASNNVRNTPIIEGTNSFTTVYEAIKGMRQTERVVKCFNSTGFENMLDPTYQGTGIDMFCAGNSQEAKAIAKQLSADIGFANCYDFGTDDKVALLEKFALCWINLAIMQGHGRDLAFKLVRR